MSQDISTNQSTSEPVSESTIPLQPWSAEAYADKLMDDLFSDIDKILEGSKLPTEPAKSEYISLQPVKIPQITMPSAVVSLGQVLAQPSHPANAKQPAKSDAVSEAESFATPALKAGRYFNKILLVVTCSSIIISLILWWANRDKLRLPSLLNPAATPHQNALSPSDAQFINYMLRSLELIEHKTQVSRQQTNPDVLPARQGGMAVGMPVYSQPSPPVASNQPQVPNPAPTVVGVYIPGYPRPQYQQYQPLPNAQLAPPSGGSIHPLAPSSIHPSAGISIAAQPSHPSAVRSSATPAPTAQMPTPAPATPEAKHTLVGLLYLGDRSAALFDISGVTQRIQVGEPIGVSGWTLVTVTKEEAIIRRNGEVRSIYTGQKF